MLAPGADLFDGTISRMFASVVPIRTRSGSRGPRGGRLCRYHEPAERPGHASDGRRLSDGSSPAPAGARDRRPARVVLIDGCSTGSTPAPATPSRRELAPTPVVGGLATHTVGRRAREADYALVDCRTSPEPRCRASCEGRGLTCISRRRADVHRPIPPTVQREPRQPPRGPSSASFALALPPFPGSRRRWPRPRHRYAAGRATADHRRPVDGRVAQWHAKKDRSPGIRRPRLRHHRQHPRSSASAAERDAISARIEAARARFVAIEQRIRAMGSRRRPRFAPRATARGWAATGFLRQSSRRGGAGCIQAAVLNADRQKRCSLASRVEACRRARGGRSADPDRTSSARGGALGSAVGEVALTADIDQVDNDSLASISDAQAARAAAEPRSRRRARSLTRIEVAWLAPNPAGDGEAPGTVLRVIASRAQRW